METLRGLLIVTIRGLLMVTLMGLLMVTLRGLLMVTQKKSNFVCGRCVEPEFISKTEMRFPDFV